MNLNKICETLYEIQVNNQEQKEALDYAIDCVKKRNSTVSYSER